MLIQQSGSFLAFQGAHLIRLGALAPSRHNTQPWKFSIERNTVRVCPDFTRRLPTIDPEDRSIYLSLGCVAENIVLAADYHGLSTELEHSGSRADGSVLIHVIPHGRHSTSELIPVMALRQCSRHPFAEGKIAGPHLKKLVYASRQPGVEFGLVTDSCGISRIADVLRARGDDKAGIGPIAAELASWTRFNRREAECSRDGLLFTGMGYPPMPRCIGRRLVAALVRANRQSGKSASFVQSSAALIVFAPHKDDKVHWFNVGRSFQRVVLTAASLRIRYAHLQLPYASPAHHRDLRWCFGLSDGQELLAARLGYSDLAPRSLRRPLSHLLTGWPADAPPRAVSQSDGTEWETTREFASNG